MTDPSVELRDYLRKLINRFLVIHSLSEQLQAMKKWERPKRVVALKTGSYFFKLVRYSFDRTILIELSMLLSDREEKSLVDFLTKAKENARILRPHRYNPISERSEVIAPETYSRICNRHLLAIKKQGKIVEKIKARRDSAFAHADSRYFNDPEGFLKKYPVDVKELRKLLRTTGNIMRWQHIFLFDSDLLMKVHSVHGVELVLTYVRAFSRVWDDRKLVFEKGVSPRVYKLDKYHEGSSIANLEQRS